MKEIVMLVSTHFGVFEKRVYERNKRRDVCKARQVSMYLINKHLKLSSVEIGKHFYRNHATVLHALKAVNNDMATNEAYLKDVEELSWKVRKLKRYSISTLKNCLPSDILIRKNT